ncbi:MAG TPA: ABC transporter substrate-binding protein [Balneolaceae bacterium]|nr:ABC transporter substrate-binding protein [Balneolaceae bacterium]
MKKVFKIALLVIFALAANGMFTDTHAQKSKEDIRQMLDKRNEEIKELLGPKGKDYSAEQREQLKDIINDVIDYKAMAKFALQDTWNTLDEQEREDFVELFSKIVRDHSLTNLDIYRAKVTYESIQVEGDNAVVVTMATLDRVRTPVTYDLFFKDDLGKWVVTDLIIDNVSTAKSYKRQFQDIIRDKGYDYLLKTLRDRAKR